MMFSRHDSHSRRRLRLTMLAVIAGFLPSLGFVRAESDPEGLIIAVIHVDVMPPYTQPAAALLAHFRRDSLGDAGEKNFQVLQEIGRPNHFTLVEEWSDRMAYDAHNAATHTRHFRDELQPMLGSPFDERLHTELGDAP